MTTYNDFVTYWQGITSDVPAIKTVTVGADDQLLDMQQQPGIAYPHLRVESPALQYVNNDENEITRYRFRIYILTNVPVSTTEAENAALSQTETIMRSVYRQLWLDADSGEFDLVIDSAQGDNIQQWSGDNDFGWYLEITLDLYQGTC